jgi:hypothetical protein
MRAAISVPPLVDVHHHLIRAPVRARLAASGPTQVGGITVPDWHKGRAGGAGSSPGRRRGRVAVRQRSDRRRWRPDADAGPGIQPVLRRTPHPSSAAVRRFRGASLPGCRRRAGRAGPGVGRSTGQWRWPGPVSARPGGDLPGHARLVQDPPAGLVVVAGVEVHHRPGRQEAEPGHGVQGRGQQPVIAAVGRRRDRAQRDAAGIDDDRALQPLLATVHRAADRAATGALVLHPSTARCSVCKPNSRWSVSTEPSAGRDPNHSY